MLDIQFTNDVFSISSIVIHHKAASDQVLCDSLEEAIKKCLECNIKFKMAAEKWGLTTLSSEERISKFVKRAVDDFMVK